MRAAEPVSGPPDPPSAQASVRPAPPSRRDAGRLIYPSGGLGGAEKAFSIVCLVMRPRPITPAPPAFVSSPGVLCFTRWSRAARQPAGSQPGKWADHRSDRRVRLVAITGSMSRARCGVPWERGGPRLAPPAGAVRLNAKAGLLTLWFDPGNRTVLSVQNLGPTVVSIRKPGGQDPRGGSTGSPLVAFSDLPCRGRGTGRPSRRRRPHPAGCFHPLTAGIGAPVSAAMSGASSVAGRAGRLHLPDPPRT